MHYAVGFSPKTLNAQVTGRGVLPPGERSNAWTVALTPGGVVDYLNRKTSPLGAHPISYLVSYIVSYILVLPSWLHPCNLQERR